MQSFKQPTPDEVDTAVALVKAPHYAEYFFDRLENPLWIVPLKERGIFASPPNIVKEKKEQFVYRWPESQYVARMACSSPIEVAEIFKDVKTDNWQIIHDIVVAAKAMPADIASTLVPVISKSFNAGFNFYGLDLIAELIENLSTGGHPQAAVELMRNTMKIDWKRGRRNQDSHWYFTGFEKHIIPALSATRPRDLIKQLSIDLKDAIQAESSQWGNPDDDYSHVWLPAIEEVDPYYQYDSREGLLDCLRKAYEQSISGGALNTTDAYKLLDRERYFLFKRLKLHLIRVFASKSESDVRSAIMDRQLFDNQNAYHEYALLVRDSFQLLTDEQQAVWLSWVAAGPEIDYPDEKIVKEMSDQWKFKRLSLVRRFLVPPLSDFVYQMLSEHGEPVLNSPRHTDFVMDQSPFSVEDLQKQKFADAVQMVSEWQPSPDPRRFESPTPEGLRRIFNQYVATDPPSFAPHAALLKEKPAPFVRGFFEAMLQALRDKKQIDVMPLLELSEWVVSRPLNERYWPIQDDERMYDHNWQWTWDSVANVWEQMLATAPPIEIRGRVWKVIEKLLGGSAHSGYDIDSETKDIRLMDFITHSINSSQGKAMEVLFAYARWVSLKSAVEKGAHKVLEGGFEKLPEVREALEAKLLPRATSFASRAMYGWNFNVLFWMDKSWLQSNIATIFDLKQFEIEPNTAYGWAAWNCFLRSRQPRSEYFDLLKEQFSYAVDQVAVGDDDDHPRVKPFGRLGEHLMVLYAIGHIGLDSEEKLIRRFFERAPVPLRSAIVEFVGHALEPTDEIEPSVIERCKALWEWYWPTFGKSDAAKEPNSSVFGSWFVCGKFDNQWTIERLEEFSGVVPKVGPEHRIVQCLAKNASVDVLRSMKILDRLIRGDTDGWRIHSWRDDIKTILELALAAGSESELLAKETIDRLGRRRFNEFGALLRKTS